MTVSPGLDDFPAGPVYSPQEPLRPLEAHGQGRGPVLPTVGPGAPSPWQNSLTVPGPVGGLAEFPPGLPIEQVPQQERWQRLQRALQRLTTQADVLLSRIESLEANNVALRLEVQALRGRERTRETQED